MIFKGTAAEIARAIFESERRSRVAAFARSFDEKLADLIALQRMANAVSRAAGRPEGPVWPERRDRAKEGTSRSGGA